MPSLSADAMCFLNDYVESELGSFKFLRDPRGCAMVQHDCPNCLLYHLEQPSETTTFSTSLILLAWQLHRFEWLLKKIQRTSNKVERLDFHLTLTCGYLYNSDASNIMTDIRLFIFVSKTSDLLPLTISNQHIEHQDWIDALYTNHGDNRLDRPAGWLHPPPGYKYLRSRAADQQSNWQLMVSQDIMRKADTSAKKDESSVKTVQNSAN
ncbi:hypothetical protein F5878DRAFT_644962 [Lentinula raphanica]|uniref:Uncharacterized protein n=1 Tax=Lentinula raphanica TaxID=153919 RepID=A0AA38P1T5_9AGAR|nr:hypothetical protein F5878DRAFT_644962 [Lentinula raphanica]